MFPLQAYPFELDQEPPAEGEAIFGAKTPGLLLRDATTSVQFRYGRYRTRDPEEIAFLLRVIGPHPESATDVWVIHLPDQQPKPEAKRAPADQNDEDQDEGGRAVRATRARAR